MNGKKDIMGWASIGFSVMALALASISVFVSSRTCAYQEDIYRELENKSYTRIVEELEEIMSAAGDFYQTKPTTITEVMEPLMREMEPE